MQEFHLIELRNLILKQADYFLKDAGEFYPFGVAVDAALSYKPLGAFVEEDNPTSEKLIQLLESAVKQNISAKKYIAAAIAVNVNITTNHGSISGIKIMYFSSDDTFYELMSYAFENDTYKFLPLQSK